MLPPAGCNFVAQAPRLREGQRRGRRREAEFDLAGDRVGERRRHAGVMHGLQFDRRHVGEEFRRHLHHAADAGGAVVQLARIRSGQRDEILHRAHRQRRIHHQHVADVLCRQRDRDQVLRRVVGHVLEEIRIGRVGGRLQQERVAVGRALGDEIRAEHAAAPAAIFEDEVGAERRPEFLADDAADHVRPGARAVGHDDADEFGRIVFLRHSGSRGCACRERKRSGQRGRNDGMVFHRIPLPRVLELRFSSPATRTTRGPCSTLCRLH